MNSEPSTIREAPEQPGDPCVMEGPYISSQEGPRGAHNPQHIRTPNWDEFQKLQDSANGMIRLLTLAPETEGAIPFIEKLTRSGVVVALGHTAAKKQSIQAAIGAGAKLSTHLGNGSHDGFPYSLIDKRP